MKTWKIVLIAILSYVGVVIVFESLLGAFQPRSGDSLVLTTFAEDGTAHERVISRLQSDGRLYLAANHWPRAWYDRALAHPDVEITMEGETRPYTAVAVTGDESERVDGENPLGPVIRVLTGFAPRRFLRLDPRPAGT